MQILPVLLQADPGSVQAPLRGFEAIQAVDGWVVALVGMGVVFSALFTLFLMMNGLRLLLEPKPKPEIVGTSPEQRQIEADGPTGLTPRLVAAIASAIRLEQQRRAEFVAAPGPATASGWKVARSLQWASHQRIFMRHGR